MPEGIFVVVPILMIAVALVAALRTVRRYLRLRAAWAGGATAEARCLRAYTTTSGDRRHVRSTQHHVYEFTDRMGRSVRFEETDGPSTTVLGDNVVVHYPPDRPDRATAIPPRHSGELARMVATLAFLTVFVGLCIVFIRVAHGLVTADATVFSELP
ncbi:DUF3592 domain-containing protein [Streptomyces sp. NPDC051776]|uniref:DUF3592 domain-containing protein n=1 Tax=Streptomyces sp. NPDC051776 TaxID=3155414 RepID=UPI0034450A9B